MILLRELQPRQILMPAAVKRIKQQKHEKERNEHRQHGDRLNTLTQHDGRVAREKEHIAHGAQRERKPRNAPDALGGKRAEQPRNPPCRGEAVDRAECRCKSKGEQRRGGQADRQGVAELRTRIEDQGEQNADLHEPDPG